MIVVRIEAGFSLRGLSSVTMTRSRVLRGDGAHQRALTLVAVAPAPNTTTDAV